MNLAAGTGTQLLGSIGLGGLALVLVTALVLGTKQGSRHTFKQSVALTVGLFAGTVLIGAGQIWSLPDDMTMTALSAAGVGQSGVLGTIGMGAIAIVCCLVAYLVTLKPRAAGILGVVMASVFAAAGGGWTMVSQAFAGFAMQLAGAA